MDAEVGQLLLLIYILCNTNQYSGGRAVFNRIPINDENPVAIGAPEIEDDPLGDEVDMRDEWTRLKELEVQL